MITHYNQENSRRNEYYIDGKKYSVGIMKHLGKIPGVKSGLLLLTLALAPPILGGCPATKNNSPYITTTNNNSSYCDSCNTVQRAWERESAKRAIEADRQRRYCRDHPGDSDCVLEDIRNENGAGDSGGPAPGPGPGPGGGVGGGDGGGVGKNIDYSKKKVLVANNDVASYFGINSLYSNIISEARENYNLVK